MKTVDIIITPNRRLASYLRQKGVTQHSEPVCRTTRIYAWQDFIDHYADTQREGLKLDKVCLNTWQVDKLWHTIISDYAEQHPLLNIAETVQLARSAYELCAQWCVSVDRLDADKSQTLAFQQWAQAYEAQLESLNAFDPVHKARYLMEGLEQSTVFERPESFMLLAFDEITPLQQAFLSALKSSGAIEIESDEPSDLKTGVVCKAQDSRQELWAAASFAKKQYLANPEQRIGIVLPDLKNEWARVVDVFEKVFHECDEFPINISSGLPLGHVPIIQAALQLLSLEDDLLAMQSISYVLLTPFIAQGQSEAFERSRLDVRLRDLQRHEINWRDFIRLSEIAPVFHTVIQRVQALRQTLPKGLKPSAWLASILELLDAWGWPGERVLNSHEYQAVEHFYRVLSELPVLDSVTRPMTYFEALNSLKRQLSTQLFQPESQDKPIQVLGVLEAAGLDFDHCWVLGLTSDVWPAKANPHPLLPTHMQVDAQMPHASAQRELDFAQTLTQRLLKSSREVIFSFAGIDAESAAPLECSPLLSDMPTAPIEHFTDKSERLLERQLLDYKAVVPTEALTGLPLTTQKVSGGSSLFKDQGACPFRGYAKHRLKAQAPQKPMYGISPAVKGFLLHEVMQGVWQTLRDQQQLSDATPEACERLIDQQIDTVFSKQSPPLDKAQAFLEKKRLAEVVAQWLEIERSRSPFTIKALESPLQATFCGMTLKLRLDRVDVDNNGHVLLLDYKTGEVRIDDWDSDRPDDPQLPLYAILMNPKPAAMAFARVSKKQMALCGVGTWDEAFIQQEDEASWQARLAQWEQSLTNIAEEFKAGYAAVAPKYGAHTCQFCDCQLFCRVQEKGQV